MLNEKEKHGIRSIVSKIAVHDLISLAQTITNRVVVIETPDDALNAILMYADDAVGVLGRRKVKKEHIIIYLREMGCAVSLQADKCAAVAAALTFWESKDARGNQLSFTEMELDDMPDSTEIVTPAFHNNGATPGWGAVQPQQQPPGIVNAEVIQMAQQFVGWFYPIFNNGHVALANGENNFGPHHFWSDCQLKIHTPQCEHLVDGAVATSQKLLALVGQHQLYFNPFDAPQQGIHSYLDPHGLMVVVVGGAFHCADQCVGIFEQKFGLVRDPAADNNWKIKCTELRLAGKDLDNLFEGYELEYS